MLPCARSCTFRGAQARLLAVPRNLKNALTNLGDKASKVVLYAPARTVQRFDSLVNQELISLVWGLLIDSRII